MPRPRPAQLALAAASFALVLLLLDRLLLAWLPLGAIVYRPQPEWLYEYVPGARKLFVHSDANGGDWVRVAINDEGFRGPPLRARGEARRVLVYGDSFVAAEFSPWPETWVARLGEELSQRTGEPVEAVNAGLVGAGPDQVLRRIPQEVPALAPELVVVAVTAANDFGDLVRNKLYFLRPDGSLEPRRPTLGPGLARALARGQGLRSGWGQLLRAALRGLQQRASDGTERPPVPVAEQLLAQATAEHRDAIVERAPIVRNLFVDSYDADVSLTPDARSARDKRRFMAAILDELDAALRATGTPWLLVVIPSPIDTTPDHFGLQPDPAAYPAYRRSALTDAVAAPARARGIPTVDLFEAFAGPDAASLYFTAGNDHWNARGQAQAASRTAERIVAEGWLGAGAAR